MKNRVTEIFELDKVTDDPRFEGFAWDDAPSILGRESRDEDLSPGFGQANENPNWKQPSLKAKWRPPTVCGRVTEFNDYPCVKMFRPAFSDRAVEALRDFLEPNGELLPIKSKTKTQFYLYNILKVTDALDRENSEIEFWCDPPTTADWIERFAFHEAKLQKLSIFRIREEPVMVLVTNQFVDRVLQHGLKGFSFRKLWPLPRGADWRMLPALSADSRNDLKKETMVLLLPLPSKGKETAIRRIAKFEDEMDMKLAAKRVNSKYYGSYEGHETVKNVYRMFFSAPDASKLLKFIRSEIEALKWSPSISACLRRGPMYDKEAPEEMVLIERK